jgi:hypothetical protein
MTSCADNYRPCFGHENQYFCENLTKMLVLIPNSARRHRYQFVLEEIRCRHSFSVNTLWQGSFNFLFLNMRVLVWCGLKRAVNELKTTHVSRICVYLLAKMLIFRNEDFLVAFKMKMACIKIRALYCNEIPIHVFLFWDLHGLSSQFPHSCVWNRFIYSQDRSTYLAAAK